MQNKKPHLVSSYVIYGAFALGLLTAVAFRAIIVFNHVNPYWVRPLWYFAVLGNFLFFLYRYRITQKRRNAVTDYKLIEKIKSQKPLEDEDRDVLIYLLSSIKRSLENINYLIIFVFSIIVILIDIALSMFE